MARNFSLLLLWLITFPVLAAEPAQKKDVKTHTFKYENPVAGEVYLVWGDKDWKTFNNIQWPARTVIRNELMYTPMNIKGGVYYLTVEGPPGTLINYGFFVSRHSTGTHIKNVWDGNYSGRINDGISYVKAKNDIIAKVNEAASASGQGAKAAIDTSLVVQQVKYYLPQAGRVEFIWGINGWMPISEAIRPERTEIRNFIMHSPMEVHGDTFVLNITVPKGVVINYGLMIKELRSGASIAGIYDEKKVPIIVKDNRIIDISPSKSTLEALTHKKEFPNLMDHWLLIFLISAILFGIHYLIKKNKPGFFPFPIAKIPAAIAFGLTLIVFLIFIRSYIIGFSWEKGEFSFTLIKNILSAGLYDALFVTGITLFFVGLLFFFRKKEKSVNAIFTVFIVVCQLTLIAGLANIQIVKMLGTPFNYQWFYYSDFLGSADSRLVLSENITLKMILSIAGLCMSMYFIAKILSLYLNKLFNTGAKYILAGSIMSFTFCFFLVSGSNINNTYVTHAKLANPVSAFVSSFINSNINPGLLSIDVKPQYKNLLASCNDNVCSPYPPGQIKNVILFIMESVPAAYLDVYGGTYGVTPNLAAYKASSLYFENIYAHSPSTNRAMVSILGGVYPWISVKSITREHPHINLPTISSELKKKGYRTSFFTSADNNFQGVDNFLAHRKFDKVEDFRNPYCSKNKLSIKGKSWDNLDGGDDECLFNSFTDWASLDSTKPFFSLLWTMQTHYPYFISGEEINYNVNDEPFNRYLNALRHSDEVLGKLLKWLDEKNLTESTLVAVIGDHGEAFGKHGFYGHASSIYEENVHVPLILINPLLFKGEKIESIGGHADIAPTVLSLLNVPVPKQWQGQSLLNKNKPQITYFYAPWSDYLFGFRDKNIKCIFNASNNKYEIYDLTKDPQERNNLALKMKHLIPECEQKLAAWVQHQDKYISAALN